MAEEFTTESCFNTVNTEYNAVAMLDENHVVVAYKDTGGAGYGCAKVGVISGNTVTWGAENVFNSAVTGYISVTTLDSTHFVVAYQDDGGDDYGCACVGLISGTTISSYGIENIFNSGITRHISIDTFDNTHFVISYQDAGNSLYGTAIVGVVSGITISSYGAENVFKTSSIYDEKVSTLDSTHFVIVYRDNLDSNHGSAVVGVISGTTISSYGAENTFNTASESNGVTVASLDSTHFVVAYRDAGNSNYGTAIVGVVSGTTISSYGAENVFNSAITYYCAIASLDSTHFVVTYRDNGNSDYGTAIVGVVSGTTISSYGTGNAFNSALTRYMSVTTISSTDYVVVYKDDGGDDYGCARVWQTLDESTFGTESCFNTVTTNYTCVTMLDSNHVVVAYNDSGDANHGCAKVGVIAGNTVTWGAENVFNSAATDNISIATLDSTHFVVGYKDIGNSNYGTAIIGLVSGNTISSYGAENVFNSGNTSYVSVSALDSTHFVVGYVDLGNSWYGTAIVGLTNGGTTISSYGAENVFNSATTEDLSITSLDSTHFVVAFNDSANSGHGTGMVGVISGTTISSYGAENVFNAATTYQLSVTSLDSTHFVVVYRDNGNSLYGTAIVGLTNGVTTISSYGAENVFLSATVTDPFVSTLDSTHFVVVYGKSSSGVSREGTVSGVTISSYDTEHTFNSSYTAYAGSTALSTTDYIVVYKDDGADDYGCARVWGTGSGWSGIIIGVSSPARVMGVEVTNITSVIGIS